MRYPVFLKKIIHNIKYTFKKLLHSNYIFLDWSESLNNFGDILNPLLVAYLTKKKIINVSAKYCYYDHLQVIGSILSRSNSKSIVWGSGFISQDSIFISMPKRVLAVRGPLTRKLLLEQGVNCPEVYGDPALLMSKFYIPKTTKKYMIGILPHYSDKSHAWLKNIDDDRVKIIDIQNPNPLKVIDEICSCEHIASSSLHGLIISDSYKIPSVWIKFTDKLTGGSFKFNDYFMSIKSELLKPIVMQEDITIEFLLSQSKCRDLKIDLDALTDSFPEDYK
ncbi:MAG: exosortase [Flavobacteriales bacterium]|nr:exosortase [Flavobacteriales bacterium]|tara:strand:+ start:5664 stop:6497 length:834 start_codon:yes stop_codon:yes gene_type:complete